MAWFLSMHRSRSSTNVADRRFELFRLDGAGAYSAVEDGRSTVLGVTFSTVGGPKLRIDWDGGSAEV